MMILQGVLLLVDIIVIVGASFLRLMEHFMQKPAVYTPLKDSFFLTSLHAYQLLWFSFSQW